MLWSLLKIQRLLVGIPESFEKIRKNDLWMTIFVAIEDIIFFLISSCILSVAFYYGNNGNFRIYAFVCAVVSAVFYVKTVGALSEKLALKIRELVFKIAQKVKAFWIKIKKSVSRKRGNKIGKNQNS